MKGKMNIFNQLALKRPAQSRFDLSHDVKMSLNMGKLVPTACLEVIPGDSFNISVENMLRFAPLISPVMHRVRVSTHFFFVPKRLLWDGWDEWIANRTPDVEHPFSEIDVDGFPNGSIADYLGLPTGELGSSGLFFDPSPLAAYRLIWDEYYRDQNLQGEKFVPLVAGTNPAYDSVNSENPYARAWMRDYFTSALPFAQAGDTVQIPLTTAADQVVTLNPTGQPGLIKQPDGTTIVNGDVVVGSGPTPLTNSMQVGANPSVYDPNGSLVVDVQSDAVDINTVRKAFALQRWLELMARTGRRYTEVIRAHFDVIPSDARLQRPEYIGGSKQNMVIGEVLSTAQNTEADIPVGQMSGHGISVGGGNNFSYRSEEHGFIIGIMSVMPDTAYQQGLPRMFSRITDPTDYAWPTFANLGEQVILNKEVFAATLDPDGTFGYTPRYSEYKFLNSRVAGDMRDTLSFWHLGRIFSIAPALNESFISADPSNRIFSVIDVNAHHIYAHIYNNISVKRKLPRFGIPTIE